MLFGQETFNEAIEYEKFIIEKAENNSLGCKVTRNPDDYGVDLIVYGGFHHLFYVEVELDRSGVFGQTNKLRFDLIHFPMRKTKFFTFEKPTLYVRGNRNVVMVVYIDGYKDVFEPLDIKVNIEGKHVSDNLGGFSWSKWELQGKCVVSSVDDWFNSAVNVLRNVLRI